jgi:hypothetical protein
MHEYTVEKIYHFTCEFCKNWWSYAYSDSDKNPFVKKIHCPFCGESAVATLAISSESMTENNKITT